MLGIGNIPFTLEVMIKNLNKENLKLIPCDKWLIFIVIYFILIILTFIPTLLALLKKVDLHDGGSSFGDSLEFSDEGKVKLTQHFSRIQGTLGFWKKKAETYNRFHYYILIWTLPMTVLIPFFIQAITPGNYSKWFVTLVSAHTAILFSFHKGFKVDANFKTWRQGESHFYDLYRRMLDRPNTFGDTEEEQINRYIDEVENLRKFIRNSEIDNTPTIDEVENQLKKE